MLQLSKYRGCLVVSGPEIDQIVHRWLTKFSKSGPEKQSLIDNLKIVPELFHLTVLTSQECKTLTQEQAPTEADQAPPDAEFEFITNQSNYEFQLFDLGIGQASNDKDLCLFVVIYSYELQNLRRKLKLPNQDFHITIGYTGRNLHQVPKDITSLIYSGPNTDYLLQLLRLIEHPTHLGTPKFNPNFYNFYVELLNQEYLAGLYYQAKYNLKNLGLKATYEYIRDSVLNQKWKFLANNDKSVDFYGNKILKILNYAIIGRFEKFSRYYSYKLVDQTEGASAEVSKTHSEKYYQFSYEELPRNFSYITDKLAGSSILNKRQHFQMLNELGIKTIITVMEYPVESNLYQKLDLNYHWFAVADQTPPTVEQMKAIMNLIDNGPPVVVHCMGGVGRTATVLSAYLMWSQGLSKMDSKVPLKERKTILSQSQEDFLTNWYGICQTTRYETLSHEILSHETISHEILSHETLSHETISPSNKPKLSVRLPPVIMMVGYPASGKSTLSKALQQTENRICLINQDELGRKECESLAGLAKKPNRITILDRCNLTPSERKEWLDLTHNLKTWCIYFDVDIEECQWRITRRQNHPSIKAGGGTQILKSLANKLIPPNCSEGFEKIICVDSFEAVNKLMTEWNCQIPTDLLAHTKPISDHPSGSEACEDSLILSSTTESRCVPLIKFPRTRHLQNLGSATRDDLIMDKSEVNEFLNCPIYVEEKIDGANLGISIQNNQIMVQNRSHYVNASYHPQFKYLDKWLYQHTAELWEILEPDNHILYGEWVFAKHSIKYTNLPDYFVVFDLFDRSQNKFWSRTRLEILLTPTTINLIPLITYKCFTNPAELQNLVQTASKFYDGLVEGVYARICDQDWLINRGKIVRPDFLSGNTHWKQNQLESNEFKGKPP